MDEKVAARGGRVSSWYAREMPMSCMVAMENLTDPSHVSFAHHGVTPVTSRYKPYTPSYDLMQRRGKEGYMVGESKYRAEFGGSSAARSVVDVRGFPSLLHLQTRGPRKDEHGGPSGLDQEHTFGGDSLVSNVTMYVTPTTRTSCRLIIRSESYSQPSSSLFARVFKLLPIWFRHAFFQSALLDGDMVFLHRQSLQLMGGTIMPKDYFLPAASDAPTRELHRHYARHCAHGVNYYPHTVSKTVLPAEHLLDRHAQHVKDCVHCSAALEALRRGMWGVRLVAACAAVAAGLALVAGLFSGGNFRWAVVVAGGLVGVAAGLVGGVLRALERKFLFEPYVHQDKS